MLLKVAAQYTAYGLKIFHNTTDHQGRILFPSITQVVRPHPASFLNAIMKKNKTSTPTNIRGGSGIITSFIKRNTPQKKTLKVSEIRIWRGVQEIVMAGRENKDFTDPLYTITAWVI